MFKAVDLFDLTQTEHAALFDGCEFAWDALKKIEPYLAKVPRQNPLKRFPGASIGEKVFIGEGTFVEPGALIKGPAIIGKNCQIRHNAYIRENVIIGDDCVVDDAIVADDDVLADVGVVANLAVLPDDGRAFDER